MIIRIRELIKTYHLGAIDVPALRGLDLEFPQGDYAAIVGPSGSGKSTLMHIIGCLDRPSSGVYELRGRRVDSLGDHELSQTRNREIGFIFQSFNLLPQMTVQQNVELPMLYAGLHRRERQTRASAAIERVGLQDRIRHLPNELSGGPRQRVAIARALVNNPAILLADEPTGNLDTRTGEEIMALFAEVHAAGNTLIVVTHEHDIALHARRIVHIRDGVVERIQAVQREPVLAAT
ncbi:ABC transporter ATP-binding protein [Candidatus Poribacteria bacterium]|nr:ABC transporter ATP-binding protein [Candidatus Poribacteria bacterium]